MIHLLVELIFLWGHRQYTGQNEECSVTKMKVCDVAYSSHFKLNNQKQFSEDELLKPRLSSKKEPAI